MKNRNAFVYFIVVLNLGCATIYNSGNQTFRVTSTDEKEKIAVVVQTPDGSYNADLPTAVVANPSTFSDTIIRIEDKCYDSTTVTVGKTVTASYWANIFNLWGFLIDPLTGAMWKYNSTVLVPAKKKSECMK